MATAAMLSIVLAICATPTQSDSSAASTSQAGAIKVRTELIQVRAVVTDRKGHPVDSLQQNDFILTDDGRPREIAFFSVTRLETARSRAPASHMHESRAAGETPAADLPRRSILFLVDEMHTSAEGLAAARSALLKFIDTQMGPRDQVALSAGDVAVPFSFEKNLLRAETNKILLPQFDQEPDHFLTPATACAILTLPQQEVNQLLRPQAKEEAGQLPLQAAEELWIRRLLDKETARPRAEAYLQQLSLRRQLILEKIRSGIESLASGPGQRILAFLSEGFTLLGPKGDISGVDLYPLFTRAAQSGVSIYCFGVNGLKPALAGAARQNPLALGIADQDRRLSQGGMFALANETGGQAFFETSNINDALAKMLDSSRVYYELAFYPSAEGDSKRFRRIGVSIRGRGDYRVRAPKGYILEQLRQSRHDAEPAAENTSLPKKTGESSATLEGARIHDMNSRPPVVSMVFRAPGSPMSVVEKSPLELIADYPELEGLSFALDQSELDALLKHVGESVEALFTNLPNTASLEDIHMERLEFSSRVAGSRHQRFQYLINAQTKNGDIGFEEYRTNLKGENVAPQGMDGSYLLTAGYAAMPVYLHPSFRSESTFRYLGKETAGNCYHVVAFAQRQNSRLSGGSFKLGDQTVFLVLQGLVWIDPDSYQVVRMRTELLAPLRDFGLQRHSTEILFGAITLRQGTKPMCLPTEVTVTVMWRGLVFRNRHLYSNYKLFTVESIDGSKQLIKP